MTTNTTTLTMVYDIHTTTLPHLSDAMCRTTNTTTTYQPQQQRIDHNHGDHTVNENMSTTMSTPHINNNYDDDHTLTTHHMLKNSTMGIGRQ